MIKGWHAYFNSKVLFKYDACYDDMCMRESSRYVCMGDNARLSGADDAMIMRR